MKEGGEGGRRGGRGGEIAEIGREWREGNGDRDGDRERGSERE